MHFPLLSDFEPKGAVAKSYGAYRYGEGLCERALFVIDNTGIIAWSYCSPIAVNPGADGILEGSRKSSAIRSRNSRTACVSVETDTMTLRIECRERRPQRMRSGGRCFDLGYGNFTVSDVMIDVLGFHPVAGFK